MRRAVIVVLVACTGLLGFALPALAHNTLTSSDPKEGSSIAAAPKTVKLTFDDDVQPGEGNQIVVGGPDNTRWTNGPVTIDGPSASIPLPALGPAGRYSVAYRILSADGHVVKGQLAFTLTKPGGGTAVGTLVSDEAGDDGVPLWVWIAGAVVLLAAGLVFALRLGREQE